MDADVVLGVEEEEEWLSTRDIISCDEITVFILFMNSCKRCMRKCEEICEDDDIVTSFSDSIRRGKGISEEVTEESACLTSLIKEVVEGSAPHLLRQLSLEETTIDRGV
jgi:hypothetical protein